MKTEEELAQEVFGPDGVLTIGEHALVAPIVVLWEITRRCNLRCLHCMNDSGTATDELSTEEARRIIREIAEAKVPFIFWSGGEPLLRADLLELVDYARSLGVANVLISNGTLLDRALVRRLREAGILKVEVNLDSHDEATYDYFRGRPGAFRDGLAGIEALVAEEMPLRANAVLTKVNLDHVPEIVGLARSLGLRELALLPLYLAGRTLENQDSLEVSREEVRARRPSWKALQEELAGEFLLCYEGGEMALKMANSLPQPGCGAGRIHLCLTPWGDAKPCPAFPDEVWAGNVRHTPLLRLWQDSPLFLSLRDPDVPGCEDCQSKPCGGGCRLRAYRAYGKLPGGPDPRCARNRSAAGPRSQDIFPGSSGQKAD